MTSPRIQQYSTGISVLRIISAVAVIVLHMASEWRPDLPQDSGVALFNASLKGASFFAASVFVIISGYVLMSCHADEPVRVFYKKRAYKVLWPMLFWTVLYLGIRYISSRGVTFAEAMDSLYYGMPYYHLWFLYMMVGLYLTAPLLRAFFRRSTVRTQAAATGAVLLLTWTADFVWGDPPLFFMLRFLPFLGLFMAGGLLSRVDIRPWAPLAAVVTALGVIFFGPGLAVYAHMAGVDCARFYHYDGLGCTVYALAVFVCGASYIQCAALASRAAIHAVGQMTLNVYLVHPVFVLIADKTLLRVYTPLRYAASFAGVIAASFVTVWAMRVCGRWFFRPFMAAKAQLVGE